MQDMGSIFSFRYRNYGNNDKKYKYEEPEG